MPTLTCNYCNTEYNVSNGEYNRKLKNGSKSYCSKEHACMAKRAYTSEDDKKYKAYITNKAYRERNKEKIRARKRLHHLANYIPVKKEPLPIGAETERTIRGVKRIYVKTESGWRMKYKKVRQPKSKLPKPPKIKIIKEKVKPVKKKITSAKRLVSRPQEVKKLKLTPNLEGKKLIKIDHKTWVYKKIG